MCILYTYDLGLHQQSTTVVLLLHLLLLGYALRICRARSLPRCLSGGRYANLRQAVADPPKMCESPKVYSHVTHYITSDILAFNAEDIPSADPMQAMRRA